MLLDRKRRVVLHPEDPEARFELGEALFTDGDLDGAVGQLEKALELDASHANARRMLARAYVAQDRLALAEKLLRPAADAEDPAACEALADLYLTIGRADDALLYLDTALRREPTNVGRGITAATLALGRGLVDKAVEYATQVARTSREDPRLGMLEKEIAICRGDLVGTTDSPLDRGTAFLTGRTRALLGALPRELDAVSTALRTGDLAAAKRALVMAPPGARSGPNARTFVWLRAEIALAGGDLDGAANTYRELARAATDAKERGALFSRLGEIALHRHDASAARDAYRLAVAAHETADLLEAFGDALTRVGDVAEAEDVYRKAAKMDPASLAGAKLASLRAKRKHGTAATSHVGRIGALGWGGRGGIVSTVEATAVPGHGELIFTGNVGTIGREAASVAHSCVKARADALGVADRVRAFDLHIHFTDTEQAKDGASAGVALALAAISAYRDEPLVPNLAATGEITVQGVIRPVAGLHEKLVAACLAGVRIVLLPRKNIPHIHDLPLEVRRRVALHGIDSLPEAMDLAFGLPPSRP